MRTLLIILSFSGCLHDGNCVSNTPYLDWNRASDRVVLCLLSSARSFEGGRKAANDWMEEVSRWSCYAYFHVMPIFMLCLFSCCAYFHVTPIFMLCLFSCSAYFQVVPIFMLRLFSCYAYFYVAPIFMLHLFSCWDFKLMLQRIDLYAPTLITFFNYH